MIIKELIEELENQSSERPTIKIFQKGEGYKIIAMGFKKGIILKEHSTPIPAKILVIEGKVNYKEEDKILTLNKYDEYEIPVHITHSVEALENSICLLIQAK